MRQRYIYIISVKRTVDIKKNISKELRKGELGFRGSDKWRLYGGERTKMSFSTVVD